MLGIKVLYLERRPLANDDEWIRDNPKINWIVNYNLNSGRIGWDGSCIFNLDLALLLAPVLYVQVEGAVDLEAYAANYIVVRLGQNNHL